MFPKETQAQIFLRRLEAIKKAKENEASFIPKQYVDRFKDLAAEVYPRPGYPGITSPAAAIAHVEQTFIEANELYDRYPQRCEAVFEVVAPAMLAACDCLGSVQAVLDTLPAMQKAQYEGLVSSIRQSSGIQVLRDLMNR